MELLKFKHIRTKMLAGLLPIVIITVSLLTIISLNTSYKIIDEQITEQMDARLNSEASNIEAVISEIENTSMAISRMITGTYTETKIDEFLEALSLVIYDNDYVLGSGLWFEPYAFDSKKEYCGPYVYKEGSKAVTTWDYSNAEYNYLNQEYYTMVRNSSKPKITDPYYDPTSSTVMSSTSAPIFDINHNFIGCVTVDMELSSVQSMVSDITVGKTGSAILVDSKGFYLYDKDKSKVSSSMNIKNDSNRTLAEGAGKIFQKNQGIFTYTNNKKVYDVYYKMIPQTGWYLLIQIPLDELNASVYTMRHFMITICCLAIAVVVGVIFVLVNSIVKPILTTMNFTRELSEGSGDLTYQIDISSKNEIGQLVTHFNKFIASQRTMINDLKASEDSLGKLSRQLGSSSQESASAIAQIMANIEGVRHQTAQQQETFQIVSNLLETNISKIANLDQLIIQESNGISNSSSAIEEMIGNINSVTASVERMADKYKELTVVAEDGKNLQNDVGIKINSMAEQSKTLIKANNTISSVAAQTNLLAMNAAIEAAHAGEAGKGFSVVADEIRKLAENTTKQSHAIGEQIKNITLIIDEVVSSSGGAQKSFATIKERINEVSNLVHEISNAMAEQSEASKQVLESLSDMTNSSSVVKSTATELQNDSLRIQSSLEDLVQVVQTVNSSMDEMAIGAKDINDSAQKIADMTRETNGNIDYLHGLVKKFKTE